MGFSEHGGENSKTSSETQAIGGLRQFALKLCVAVTLAVILLALGELCAFVYRSHLLSRLNRFVSHRLGMSDRTTKDYGRQLQGSYRLQYLSYIGWRRAPYKTQMISVDAKGLRRTLHTQCDDKTNTIWMFGDSTLWGTGSADWETIPSFLAAQFENVGEKVCVKNYGETAWASTQGVVELMLELKRVARKPDLVIFYDSTGDIFIPYAEGLADVFEGYNHFRQQLDNWREIEQPGFKYLGKSNTHMVLELLAKKLDSPKPSSGPPLSADKTAAMARWTVENYLGNIDIVDALAVHYGFRDVFFWHPSTFAGRKLLTEDEQATQRAFEQRYPGLGNLYRQAYELCRVTRRPNLFYLGDIFDEQTQQLFIDTAHLNPEGNRLVSELIFRIVHER